MDPSLRAGDVEDHYAAGIVSSLCYFTCTFDRQLECDRYANNTRPVPLAAVVWLSLHPYNSHLASNWHPYG